MSLFRSRSWSIFYDFDDSCFRYPARVSFNFLRSIVWVFYFSSLSLCWLLKVLVSLLIASAAALNSSSCSIAFASAERSSKASASSSNMNSEMVFSWVLISYWLLCSCYATFYEGKFRSSSITLKLSTRFKTSDSICKPFSKVEFSWSPRWFIFYVRRLSNQAGFLAWEGFSARILRTSISTYFCFWGSFCDFSDFWPAVLSIDCIGGEPGETFWMFSEVV